MSGMPTGKAMTMNAEYTKKVEYLEELQSTYMYNIEDGQKSPFFSGREREKKRKKQERGGGATWRPIKQFFLPNNL